MNFCFSLQNQLQVPVFKNQRNKYRFPNRSENVLLQSVYYKSDNNAAAEFFTARKRYLKATG